MKCGEIIHAEVGEKRGEEAFERLLGVRGGNFSLKPFEDPGCRTLEGQWEFLIMEAVRKQDEATVLDPPPPKAAAVKREEHGSSPPFSTIDAPSEPPRDIREVMVSTAQDEVLYAWQCADIGSRLSLLQFAKKQIGKAGQLLDLGTLDRFEVEEPGGRAVARFQSDHTIWVRASARPAFAPKLTMDMPDPEPGEVGA